MWPHWEFADFAHLNFCIVNVLFCSFLNSASDKSALKIVYNKLTNSLDGKYTQVARVYSIKREHPETELLRLIITEELVKLALLWLINIWQINCSRQQVNSSSVPLTYSIWLERRCSGQYYLRQSRRFDFHHFCHGQKYLFYLCVLLCI